MQLLDALAAGTPEGKGEKRVEEAGDTAEDHPRCEASGRAQVLEISLAH
jgi:hypothetical protein